MNDYFYSVQFATMAGVLEHVDPDWIDYFGPGVYVDVGGLANEDNA